MKIIGYEKGSLENVNEIEKKFDILLPEDYKNFLIMYNGADIVDGIFYVKDLEQKLLMGGFYGVESDNKKIGLINQNEEYGDHIPDNSLLIGSDPGSGWIFLVNDGENNGIWYYDHSYFFSQSTDELNTYFICETFSEFLTILETTSPPAE